MASTGKRGRPKGTGINDQETLLKIAHILHANPNKKRTTAIKELGIGNPSVIRRLRDKYQEQELSLLAQVQGGVARLRPATSERTNQTRGTAKLASVATAQPGQRTPATARVSGEPAAQPRQAPSAAIVAPTAPADPLAALFDGLSIESMVSQFIGHVLGIDAKEIENSPITAMIRQQAQLADLVLPLLMAQFGNPAAAKVA